MDLVQDIQNTLIDYGIHAEFYKDSEFNLLNIRDKLYLHIVPLAVSSSPQNFIALQEKYQLKRQFLVHLWEDHWKFRKEIIIGRIKYHLGLCTTYHARKCKVVSVKVDRAAEFYQNNHLQGFVHAKFHFGLEMNGELLSMASFSRLRPMNKLKPGYKSAELVRFASKNGSNVRGGLTKLISHFIKSYRPDDLMTYADRDWSIGKGYQLLGFELSAITLPIMLYTNLKTGIRNLENQFPEELQVDFQQQTEHSWDVFLQEAGFIPIFNSGNLKYHLYLQ